MRPPDRGDAITIPVGAARRALGIALVLVIAAIVLATLIAQRDRIAMWLGATEPAYIDTSTYQSVVLTTNQVYFGRLRIDGDSYTLTDVYSFSGAVDPSQTGVVHLVKRGNELHGPSEPLVIPARSVLFFENMRQDSQVMKAIAQIRSGNVSTPPPAQSTPARTASPSPSASR